MCVTTLETEQNYSTVMGGSLFQLYTDERAQAYVYVCSSQEIWVLALVSKWESLLVNFSSSHEKGIQEKQVLYDLPYMWPLEKLKKQRGGWFLHEGRGRDGKILVQRYKIPVREISSRELLTTR